MYVLKIFLVFRMFELFKIEVIFAQTVFLLLFLTNAQADVIPKRHDFPVNKKERAVVIDVVDVIDMPIDHFSLFSDTFELRYACNDQFYNGSGPFLLYIGGEASLQDQIGAINSGLMFEMASDLNGYMCITEHRYYGDSVPNYNLETFNMRFLTFGQALADLAYFIKDRLNNIQGVGKVIVVGGSYPGSLSAWMRLKYPDLVDAAVSSSAVLEIKTDFYEYNEIVQKDISHNEACLDTLKNGILTMQNYTKSKRGLKKLRRDLDLCEPTQTKDKLSIQTMFDNIVVLIGNIAQYNNQGVYMTIDEMCDILLLNSTMYDDYTRLTAFVDIWMKQYANSQCIPSYRSTVGAYRITGLNNGRPWLYQMCSQLGFFITTDSKNQPFSNTVPLSYWYHLCQDVFGERFNPVRVNLGIENTKQEYGSQSMKRVKKVVYTIGTADPVSGVGLQSSLNQDAPLIKIDGATHCMDLGQAEQSDSPALTAARKEIKKYIYTWVS